MNPTTQYYHYTNSHSGGTGIRTRPELASLLSSTKAPLTITWTISHDSYRLTRSLLEHRNILLSTPFRAIDTPRHRESSMTFAVRVLSAHCPYTTSLFLQ